MADAAKLVPDFADMASKNVVGRTPELELTPNE